jgi:hypothetical protein
MPLSEQRLTNKFIAIIEKMQLEDKDANNAKVLFAKEMAKAVVEELKEIKIIYTTGLVAPSGGGPVTGTITHTIS